MQNMPHPHFPHRRTNYPNLLPLWQFQKFTATQSSPPKHTHIAETLTHARQD
jgi:hypothetical protein